MALMGLVGSVVGAKHTGTVSRRAPPHAIQQRRSIHDQVYAPSVMNTATVQQEGRPRQVFIRFSFQTPPERSTVTRRPGVTPPTNAPDDYLSSSPYACRHAFRPE